MLRSDAVSQTALEPLEAPYCKWKDWAFCVWRGEADVAWLGDTDTFGKEYRTYCTKCHSMGAPDSKVTL